jgi:adenylate cyclase
MTDIFISYARATEPEAKRVAEALTGLGYGVWRDDQLAAHEAYGDVIEQRLRAAKAVVVLWSAEAVKSQWVRSEADRARAANKLVQLNVDGVSLPMPFDQIHCASLKGWRGDPDAPGWRQALAGVMKLVDPAKAGRARADAAPASLPGAAEKPSIAALPFANLSGDPDQEYFVDGLMEELVTCLTRIRTLFVIAGGSSLSLKGQDIEPREAAHRLGVRYVLQGSVRKAGERVRVAVKLIDASVGTQIWAERFEDKLDDIFALQDRVAAAIAGVVEFSVQQAEAVHALNRPTSDLGAYDLRLRAVNEIRIYSRESVYRALDLLDQALERDPNYGLALSLSAAAHAIIMQFQWTDDMAGHGQKLMEMVDRSLRFGSDEPEVLACAALAYWTAGDLAAGLRLADRAMALNPGSSFSQLARGQIGAAMGDLEVAEDCTLRSMQLDPLSPNRSMQLGALAAIRFAQGRFAEAADIAREWSGTASHALSVGMVAAANGQVGAARAAREALARLKDLSPMSMDDLSRMFYQKQEHRALFLDGIAKAEMLSA